MRRLLDAAARPADLAGRAARRRSGSRVAIFSFAVTVTFWSVALGGLTYGAWDWALPDAVDRPEQPGPARAASAWRAPPAGGSPLYTAHRPRVRRPRCRSSSAACALLQAQLGRVLLTSRAATQARARPADRGPQRRRRRRGGGAAPAGARHPRRPAAAAGPAEHGPRPRPAAARPRPGRRPDARSARPPAWPARRSRSCGRSPAASPRRCSPTAGSPPRSPRVAARSPVPVELAVDLPSRAARAGHREHRLLRRQRGAGQRGQAQRRRPPAGSTSAAPAAGCGSSSRTTAPAAPCSRPGHGLAGLDRPAARRRRRPDRRQPARRPHPADGGAPVRRESLRRGLGPPPRGPGPAARGGRHRGGRRGRRRPVAGPGGARAPPGRRRRRRPDAARRTPTRGCAPPSRRGRRCPGRRCWCSRSTSRSPTPTSCWPTAPAASATCSRTGWRTSTRS